MFKSKVSNKDFSIEHHEDLPILKVIYHERLDIDVAIANRIIEGVYESVSEGYILGITDATANDLHINKEARALFKSNDSVALSKAHAVIVKNLANRIMASFFIKIDRPLVETKIFTSESEAITWLKAKMD